MTFTASDVTKNELMRAMLKTCQHNGQRYRYVLSDSWFCSAENMKYIQQELNKEFIMAIKANRTLALSLEDKQQGRYVRVDTLALEPSVVAQVYLKGVAFPVGLAKQVFKNQDGSQGVLYLVSSDLRLDYETLTTTYQKRWHVEVFHKSHVYQLSKKL